MKNVIEAEYERLWECEIREAFLKSSLSWKNYRPLHYERDGRMLSALPDTPEKSLVWIEFCQGAYDNWCACVIRKDDVSTFYMAFPTDEYYFSRLGLLAIRYGREKVYKDLRALYSMTTNKISDDVIAVIKMIASDYGIDENIAYNMFMHVYYGMIAEEHYSRTYGVGIIPKRTKVGKLMKMYAIHRFLIECRGVYDVATECVNMSPSKVLEQAAAMGLSRDITWQPYDSSYDEEIMQPIVSYGSKKQI